MSYYDELELAPFKRFVGRYQLTPSIVFGKSVRTQQFTVTSTPIQIIPPVEARMYVLGVIDTVNAVFIGGQDVSIVSGFAVNAYISPLVFSMTENAQLWAVSGGSVVCFLIDMGI